jgi:simple sugar transport system ATP-binding protein
MILDEPTSMLTPGEIEELLKTLHRMTEEGKTIIFITHKLDEVTAVSDRVTVLREGKVIASLKTAETNERELARLMVGREVLFRLSKEKAPVGEVVLQIDDLQALDDRELPALRGISLNVRAGEILGLAGVAGNGQRELVETLIGLRKSTGGQVYLQGREITHLSPRERIDARLACVPGERFTALIPTMSVAENMILKNYRYPPISKGPFLDRQAVGQYAERLIAEYSIATPDPWTPLKLLSGGNIQRALLARELSANPVLLVAAHPTSGLDVGATETIWQLLLEQRTQGRAVLMISEALEEIMTLSDRIAVIYEGEIMGVVRSEDAELEEIGLMMAGAHRIPMEAWA